MKEDPRIPFIWDWTTKKDLYLEEKAVGWSDSDKDAAISLLGRVDPLCYYMHCGIDIGFYYNGSKYWIESPFEDFRKRGGDFWSLSICDKLNPEWNGKYLFGKYLGTMRHDADDRSELCFYDGIEDFLKNAKIDGKDIRRVLDKAYITDL